MDLYLGVAVVIATLLGPILAVFVTRYVDRRRERTTRQYELFRALMRSRRSNLSPEYVSALNTVEIEFAGVKSVDDAQRLLFQHLNTRPQPPDWIERLNRLQTRLLYAIAKQLGFEVEQLDVLEGGYVPQGWGTTEEQNTEVRNNILEVLRGKRALKIEAATSLPNTTMPDMVPAKGESFLFKGAQIGTIQNFGIVQFGDGKIDGFDLLGTTYEGNYIIDHMRLKIFGEMIVHREISLPGATPISAGTKLPFTVDWPVPIPQSQTLALKVAGNDSTVLVERIRI
jgi:hypothetical protein